MRRPRRSGALGMLLGAPVLCGLVLASCGGTNQPETAVTTTSAVPTTTAASSTTGPSSGQHGTSTVRVWFLNQHHAATGAEPLFEPVERRVEGTALGARALDALFAGPTAAERAEGLRLITSGATGYTRLHIQSGIASVTLQGGCSSGGSTMTIAGEITPTLKQFSSVTYVKIFAPDGTTEAPNGPVDSIPTCLEP